VVEFSVLLVEGNSFLDLVVEDIFVFFVSKGIKFTGVEAEWNSDCTEIVERWSRLAINLHVFFFSKVVSLELL